MGTVGFYQISQSFFVCEGWKGQDSDGRWHHLQVVDTASAFFECTCIKDKTKEKDCVHRRYMRAEGLRAFSSSEHQFPRGNILVLSFHTPAEPPADVDCKVVLFSRELTPDNETISLFSVAHPSKMQLKYRVIVTHVGEFSGAGSWNCFKDSGKAYCPHTNLARAYLLKLDPDSAAVKDTSPDVTAFADTPLGSTLSARSVSHLNIMPPVWAVLPRKPLLYPCTHNENPPTVIPLDDHARCRCGAIRDSTRPTSLLNCVVYTMCRAIHTTIEVQMCYKCSIGRHTYVGDCRDLGFFNYNNRTLFSHALFNDYIYAFTSSETPFCCSQLKPLQATAFFLYADLLVLGGEDMNCPDCGSHPKETIWDGVTLAFGRTKLSGSMCPPTTLLDNHPVHDKAHYVYRQTVLVEPDLRKAVRKILTTPPKFVPRARPAAVEGVDKEEVSQAVTDADTKLAAQVLDRVQITPGVCDQLKALNPGLGTLFEKYFGLAAAHVGVSPPAVYVDLYKQITAKESALQMITLPVLKNLNVFRNDHTPANHILLLALPAVYNILKFHQGDPLALTTHILSILDFLSEHTHDVATRLTNKRTALEIPDPELAARMDPWEESGSYYSMPQIRLRPAYPHLKHDQTAEGGQQGATCNKFYNQYGQQRLTGGIMCVWCTHSICYGFHCIPQAEGRNDIFSAIVAHWPNAPSKVIYNFSCALATYCMMREPYFFANTHFLIDDFHAFGHTKCSHTAFLKTYAEVDPRLAVINSSAAECGNGGISRIRKGVSYMGQKRAIVFTHLFISIWNRVIIIKKFAPSV
ncbi:hypothetical protein C8R43DRAFT_1117917 [Mycena crocata]|nr:hypothetical protein C8R43DRAFT_1117917 [Mycena crocata]